MAHDVFISHSSKDKTVASAVCAALETDDIRCWVAPRDIRPGLTWAEAIAGAIEKSKVMVLIFSSDSNNSKEVLKEMTLALDSGVIVIPFRIELIEPKGAMRYYLSDVHWLDALNPPTKKQIKELVKTIKPIVGIGTDDKKKKEVEREAGRQETPKDSKGKSGKAADDEEKVPEDDRKKDVKEKNKLEEIKEDK